MCFDPAFSRTSGYIAGFLFGNAERMELLIIDNVDKSWDDLSDLTGGHYLSSIASNAFDMMMKFYGDQDNCLTVKYSFNYQVTKNLILSNINHIRAWLWLPPVECLIMIMMIVMIMTDIMMTIITAGLGCGRPLLSV